MAAAERFIRDGAPVIFSAALLWACVRAFPIPEIRPYAGVIFVVHWLAFLPSTYQAPGRMFRLGNWAKVISGGSVILATFLGLSHVSSFSSGKDARGAWARKCVVASIIVVVWAAVKTSLVGHGRRSFPYWYRGMGINWCLFTSSQQALIIFLQGAPLWILTSRPFSNGNHDTSEAIVHATLSHVDVTGLALWTLGVIIVAISDRQRNSYAAEAREMGDKALLKSVSVHVTTEGLWKYSRHPDFFGESLVWSGISLFCADLSLDFSDGNLFAFLLNFASPLCTYAIFALVTIPGLEADQQRKLNQFPWFRSYLADTPLMVPYRLWFQKSSSLEAEIAADRTAFHQPVDRGRYKSSRADTILEALAASKKKKMEQREDIRRKAKHKRSKTPEASADSGRKRAQKRKKKKVVVE